jgi:hypothetical protein
MCIHPPPPIRATYSVHAMPYDLIIQIILGEGYKLWSLARVDFPPQSAVDRSKNKTRRRREKRQKLRFTRLITLYLKGRQTFLVGWRLRTSFNIQRVPYQSPEKKSISQSSNVIIHNFASLRPQMRSTVDTVLF